MDFEYLHLGCGLCSPPGWLNVDGSWQVVLARHRWAKSLLMKLKILPASRAATVWGTNIVRLNLTRPLPFSTCQFKAVYSSHTLEHLYHADARRLLGECWRVLQPAGICRIVVPDLRAFVDRYLLERGQDLATAAEALMERLGTHPRSINRGLLAAYQRLTTYHDHKWMYDGASLSALLEDVGFCEVSVRGYLDSAIPQIGEVEQSGRLLEGAGVAVEGRKPTAGQRVD